MTQDEGKLDSERKLIDDERKHLEGLLKDRTNFYLVFASLFILGTVRTQGESFAARPFILLVGTIASVLIALAVWRTHRLVDLALKDITQEKFQHPYRTYRESIRFPPNANHLMIFVPLILSLLFLVLTIQEFFIYSSKHIQLEKATTTATSNTVLADENQSWMDTFLEAVKLQEPRRGSK